MSREKNNILLSHLWWEVETQQRTGDVHSQETDTELIKDWESHETAVCILFPYTTSPKIYFQQFFLPIINKNEIKKVVKVLETVPVDTIFI